MFKYLVAFVLLGLFSTFSHSYDSPDSWWVMAQFRERAQLQVAAAHFQHLKVDAKLQRFELDADREEIEWLRDHGFAVHIDLAKSAQLQSVLNDDMKSIPNFVCYRTVEETRATAASLAVTYPNLVEVVDIGSSWERSQNIANGYTLQVLRLRNNAVPAPVGGKPILFAIGGIHAREYTPPELLTRFAETLLSEYGINPDSTWLLDRFEFHLLLHANPDGRKKAETGLSWRKNTNIANALCPTNANNSGVDLNRNFPFHWNTTAGVGSSGSICNGTYRGPLAQSEPEIVAIVNYLNAIFPDQRPDDINAAAPLDTRGMFLDIHSFSQLVVWPWGDTDAPTPNALGYNVLGRRLASFNGYTPAQSSDPTFLYRTDGTSSDTGYGQLGVPSLALELGVAFFENCDSFNSSTLPLNLAALRYAARTLHAPFLLSLGPDAKNLQLSSASVVRGASVNLSGLIDDNIFSDSNGVQTRFPIHSAAVFLDTMPWDGSAAFGNANALDGAFDEVSEPFTLSIDTSTFSLGRHLLVVQGRNTRELNGAPGTPSAIFLEVTEAPLPDALFADQFE